MIVLKYGIKYMSNCVFCLKKYECLCQNVTTESKGQLSMLVSIILSLALTLFNISLLTSFLPPFL